MVQNALSEDIKGHKHSCRGMDLALLWHDISILVVGQEKQKKMLAGPQGDVGEIFEIWGPRQKNRAPWRKMATTAQGCPIAASWYVQQ